MNFKTVFKYSSIYTFPKQLYKSVENHPRNYPGEEENINLFRQFYVFYLLHYSLAHKIKSNKILKNIFKINFKFNKNTIKII